MGRFLAACLVIASLGGCALLANANANHNSGGTACLDEPIFGVIDLVIAGVSAAAIGASDESAGWYAVPGVFAASGLLGTISAYRCRGDDNGGAEAPPASNTAPSFGDAPVDPEAREATREELGLDPNPPATQPELRLDRNGLPASLPPPPSRPVPAPVASDPGSKPPKPIDCTLTPRKECPDGYYCKLVEENTGVCEAIR